MANGRCRLHGGKCTGPRTEKGKADFKAAHTKHGRYTAPKRVANLYAWTLAVRSHLTREAHRLSAHLPADMAARQAQVPVELWPPVHPTNHPYVTNPESAWLSAKSLPPPPRPPPHRPPKQYHPQTARPGRRAPGGPRRESRHGTVAPGHRRRPRGQTRRPRCQARGQTRGKGSQATGARRPDRSTPNPARAPNPCRRPPNVHRPPPRPAGPDRAQHRRQPPGTRACRPRRRTAHPSQPPAARVPDARPNRSVQIIPY